VKGPRRGRGHGRGIQAKGQASQLPKVPCWRVLRHVDKFSGAAGAAAEGGAAGTGPTGGSTGGRSAKSHSHDDGEDLGAGGYQARSRGATAAKRDKTEDIRLSRVLKPGTEALSALAQATSERTTAAFFFIVEMRDTPEANSFCCAHARKLMAADGLNVSTLVTLSSLAGAAAASTPAPGAHVPAEGRTTLTPPAVT